jgi:hypothetical protein
MATFSNNTNPCNSYAGPCNPCAGGAVPCGPSKTCNNANLVLTTAATVTASTTGTGVVPFVVSTINPTGTSNIVDNGNGTVTLQPGTYYISYTVTPASATALENFTVALQTSQSGATTPTYTTIPGTTSVGTANLTTDNALSDSVSNATVVNISGTKVLGLYILSSVDNANTASTTPISLPADESSLQIIQLA